MRKKYRNLIFAVFTNKEKLVDDVSIIEKT